MINELIDDEKIKEITWHAVNSILAGALVFLGSLSTGKITYNAIAAAIGAAGVVAATKFQKYWKRNKKSLTKGLFNFI